MTSIKRVARLLFSRKTPQRLQVAQRQGTFLLSAGQTSTLRSPFFFLHFVKANTQHSLCSFTQAKHCSPPGALLMCHPTTRQETRQGRYVSLFQKPAPALPMMLIRPM